MSFVSFRVSLVFFFFFKSFLGFKATELSEANSLMENNMAEEIKYNSGQQDLLSFKHMVLSLVLLKAPCYSFLSLGEADLELRNAPVSVNAGHY